MLSVYGQTLGKMALGIRVVGLDGGRVRPHQALIRTLARNGVAATTLLGGIGKLLPLADPIAIFTSKRRCLHDYCAQTHVIKKTLIATATSA
jgi:uncharacterized RDD family membrane protein YckC